MDIELQLKTLHLQEAMLTDRTDSASEIPRSGFQDPPAELLLSIFEFTFPSSYLPIHAGPHAAQRLEPRDLRDYLSFMLVCKTWWLAVLPMLYENVALRLKHLDPFLTTIKNDSSPLDLRSKVKHLAVECVIERLDVVVPTAVEEIMSCCPQLKSLTCIPTTANMSWWKADSKPIEMLYNHSSMSSLSHLSLGPAISSNLPFIRLLQQIPQLQSLSFHLVLNRELGSVSSVDTVELPNLTTLSVTLCSSSLMNFMNQLSTPALTSLLVSFGEYWCPEYDAVEKITASKGAHLKYLEIDTEAMFFDEFIPVQGTIQHCPVLEHLVLYKCFSFSTTHPTLRFIDIWHDLLPMERWADAAACTESRFALEPLRTICPKLERVRLLDTTLRDIPNLPTILPPTRRDEENLRLNLRETVVWDTPTLVFWEGLLRFEGTSALFPIKPFVQDVHLYVEIDLEEPFSSWGTAFETHDLPDDESS
ncbi:hypothetical protein OE88DRAFT_1665991 [Heliocybe sulcata]|uniref:F-box domain-containing protein n=1 Tax=Heliocybe sulcata TaxID=5364 RepID=A0A5C3MQP4_9AGAM|nr:hypothetical protein OE88DRAFT_1665991 [Heliocybe sulcata]